MTDAVRDTCIIGGGPAGLTAGIYAVRAGLDAVLVERMGPGGQAILTDRIENYPGFPEGVGGAELMALMEKQARALGLEIVQGDVTSVEIPHPRRRAGVDWAAAAPPLVSGQGADDAVKAVKTGSGEHRRALSIVIAAGAHFKQLGAKGEREFTGRGVSYCATCDGPLYRDEQVVVVGGGDVAVQEALFLTRFVDKVTLVHRRDRLRAVSELRKQLLADEKVEVAWQSGLKEVTGDETVDGVVIEHVETGEQRKVPCRGVFIFVGLSPQTAFLKGVVELDADGYVATDGNMETTVAGVFACGDCRRKWLRQVVGACWEGALAASSATHYVERLRGTAYE